MKNIKVQISDNETYCFDSTKKLCPQMLYGINRWFCGMFWDNHTGKQCELFPDETEKLCKCEQCLDE